jgi:hypothetical protein
MCNSYNGWTNYETWNVALWMDSDEGSQSYFRDMAEEICQDAGDKDDAINTLRSNLQSDFDDNAPELTGTYADLLSAALSSVNWYEIAEHIIEDLDFEFAPDGDE